MTKGKNLIVFTSDRFSNYFTIEVVYRRKPSGSSEPNNNKEILQGLNECGILGIIEYKTVGGKIRCFLHSDDNINKRKMICNEYMYQFKSNKYSKTLLKPKNYVF